MAKVFLHTRSEGSQTEWLNEYRYFDRVPAVGEHVALKLVDPTGLWYEVRLVVHAPFPEADVGAEVYATAVHHLEVFDRVGLSFG